VVLEFEDLRVLQAAEAVGDCIWREVVTWRGFARNTVGGQLARAADSIGANIAEAFGRFHFGEKLQFLYYARGSLFETKYWLNRALARGLMSEQQVEDFGSQLTGLARQVNAFATTLKSQRRAAPAQSPAIRELGDEYSADLAHVLPESIISETDLEWLQSMPNR